MLYWLQAMLATIGDQPRDADTDASGGAPAVR